MQTTAKGLVIWDLPTDLYSHSQLGANFQLIDSLLDTPPKQVQILAAVPTTGNFAGRLVMLSATDSGFTAWTLIRYDGSNWRPLNYEILAALPTANLFAGRLVMLSQASGGFSAWDLVRYNGTSWSLIGGWTSINTGAGPGNIVGLQQGGDIYITSGARGLVLIDRVSGTKYRLYISNGDLEYEVVV